MTLMGIREFAASEHIRKRFGRALSPGKITEWHQAGKLVKVGSKIDVEASMAKLDELGAGQINNGVADRHVREAAEKDGISAETELTPTGRIKYKTLTLHFENQLIKLEMQLAKGTRHQKQSVKDMGYAIGNALRSAIERAVDRLAPRLAAVKTMHEREAEILKEVKSIRRTWTLDHATQVKRLRNAVTS